MYDDLLKVLPALSNAELRGLGEQIAELLNDRTTGGYAFVQSGAGSGVVALPGPGLQPIKTYHYGNRPKPPFWIKTPTQIMASELRKGAYAIKGDWVRSDTPEGSLAVLGESNRSIRPEDKRFALMRCKAGARTKVFGKFEVDGFELIMDSDGGNRDLSGYPALALAHGKPIAPIIRALVDAGIPVTA